MSHASSTTLSAPTDAKTASGVTEFCWPRQTPWQTFMIMTAGAAIARHVRYDSAGAIMAALVPMAPRIWGPKASRTEVVVMPAIMAKVSEYETRREFSTSRRDASSADTPSAVGLLHASLLVIVTPTN